MENDYLMELAHEALENMKNNIKLSELQQKLINNINEGKILQGSLTQQLVKEKLSTKDLLNAINKDLTKEELEAKLKLLDKKLDEKLENDIDPRKRKRRFMCMTFVKIEYCYNRWKENWDNIKKSGISALYYNWEIGNLTQKEHLQIYIETEPEARSYAQIMKILENPQIEFVNKKIYSQKKASDYCIKTETQIANPVMLGDLHKPGKRNDLDKCYEMIIENKSLKEIEEKNPKTFIQYQKGITDCFNRHQKELKKQQKWEPKEINVIIKAGITGSKKTVGTINEYGKDNVHILKRPNGTGGALWFNGYSNQKVLLIDEFEGWIPRGLLLGITGSAPLPLDAKYVEEIEKGWEIVVITYNTGHGPETWYKDNIMLDPAFTRRISSYEYKTKENVFNGIKNKTINFTFHGRIHEIPHTKILKETEEFEKINNNFELVLNEFININIWKFKFKNVLKQLKRTKILKLNPIKLRKLEKISEIFFKIDQFNEICRHLSELIGNYRTHADMIGSYMFIN